MKKPIYLSPPHLNSAVDKHLSAVFASNWIAPVGPALDAFEQELSAYNQVAAVCALSSGTAAIHLALDLLGVAPGDAVLVQSFTQVGSVNPICYQGAQPVFIDSEPGTWNMCPVALERAILSLREQGKGQGAQPVHSDSKQLPNRDPKTSGEPYSPPEGLSASSGQGRSDSQILSSTPSSQSTPSTRSTSSTPSTSQPLNSIKAIIPVHLYGNPAQMEAIMAIAKKYDISVVEDAAESLGSLYHGQKTSALGDMGIYSFNGNKIITTSGGGALVSQRQEWIDRARFLATQARDKAPHYQHSVLGYNYRLSNVLAGIGRGQMEVLEERVAQRRANFARYRRYFEKLKNRGYCVRFQEETPGNKSNRWLSTILIDPDENKGVSRETIRLALAEENIEARPLWKPMHLQPAFVSAPYYTKAGLCSESNAHNSVCDQLFAQGLCLPSGSNLSENDFERIFKVLDQVFC